MAGPVEQVPAGLLAWALQREAEGMKKTWENGVPET